jgi:hypothetical protein
MNSPDTSTVTALGLRYWNVTLLSGLMVTPGDFLLLLGEYRRGEKGQMRKEEDTTHGYSCFWDE